MITVKDTVCGNISNIQVLGNTWQNPENLAEIVSSGIAKDDGTFEMSILSHNKNHWTTKHLSNGSINTTTGVTTSDTTRVVGDYIKLDSGKTYKLTIPANLFAYNIFIYDKDKVLIRYLSNATVIALNSDENYIVWNGRKVDTSYFDISYLKQQNIQLEEGSVATPYEPYQGSKSTISLPIPLGSTVDKSIKDRLFYDKSKGCLVIEQLTENGVKLDKPIIHDLPLNQNIDLSSFTGTTHISVDSGEVQATFKGRVPKSTQASIQSLASKTDILSDRLENIEGLKDSQDMRYETNTGMLVAEKTVDGVVKDWKIEGKTLVNLSKVKSGSFDYSSGSSKGFLITPLSVLKKGKYYIYCDVLLNTLDNRIKLNIKYTDGTQVYPTPIALGVTGNIKYELNPTKDVEHIRMYTDNTTTGSVSIDNIVLIDNEYDGGYFEGLKSVGQDVSEIEISSCNENLFDGELEVGLINANTGQLIDLGSHTRSVNYTYLKRGKYYILNKDSHSYRIDAYVYDENKSFVKRIANAQQGMDIESNCYIKIANSIQEVNVDMNMQINVDSIKPYKPHKSHEKSILYTNELGELVPVDVLREWDKVEEKNDKTLLTVGSEEIVLNGGENWNNGFDDLGTCLRFSVNFNNYKVLTGVICDKFKHDTNVGADNEGICPNTKLSDGTWWLKILKSKLTTLDLAGFKAWLQANNVIVTYQLAAPKTYDCPNLNLSSYANETMISCQSGSLLPRMEFSITSHINELVKNHDARIKQLEEKVYKYIVKQNRLMLNSTYAADKVTFKVDVATSVSHELEVVIDQDLFQLILDNVLIGKENYVRAEIEEMMDFYVALGKINYDMWDVLWVLMEEQHNPPVEEVPEI